jgi:orotate phosphoribosyltransferase
MHRRELAGLIARASRLEGDFRLRSGARSTHYFDKYRFESDPTLLRAIVEHLGHIMPPGIDALAGLELGGVPIATALSLHTGIPAIFVRKQAKEYGTCQLAEGGAIAGRRLLVIEDIVTSGGQVVESCIALRALGAEVDQALCVIDRQAGGVEALRAISVQLHPLFEANEVA